MATDKGLERHYDFKMRLLQSKPASKQTNKQTTTPHTTLTCFGHNFTPIFSQLFFFSGQNSCFHLSDFHTDDVHSWQKNQCSLWYLGFKITSSFWNLKLLCCLFTLRLMVRQGEALAITTLHSRYCEWEAGTLTSLPGPPPDFPYGHRPIRLNLPRVC